MNVVAPQEHFQHKIDPNQREDLRKVYLHIHGSAIVDEIPEIAADLKLKRQYVKELVAVLETHADRDGNPFVHINTEAGEDNNTGPNDWYSTFYTIDDKDKDEMEYWFDQHFVGKPVEDTAEPDKTATKPKKDTNPANLPACKCGCGEICNRGRNYRPGHDARHAGRIARYIAEKDDEEVYESALSLLPTEALRKKASDMADRLLKKAAAKAQNRTPEKVAKEMAKEIAKVIDLHGEVKVGRWTYDATQNSTSKAVTYVKKDGSVHVATDRIAATFTPHGA